MKRFQKLLAIALSAALLLSVSPEIGLKASATDAENANMAIGNDCSSLNKVGYCSITKSVASGVSPDGGCISFAPSTGGGEINFPISTAAQQSAFNNAQSIVFWIKTPNVANTTMYLTVYDQRPGAVREHFGKPYPVPVNFPKMTLVSSQTGRATTHTLEWYLPIPGNFEGYVVLPKSIFTQTIEGGDNNQFDSAYFSELKIYFEANQPIAGQNFYIDDIGVTENTQIYINELINLIHSYGHSNHVDNANMVVGNGLSNTSDIGWKSIPAEIVTGVSPDGSAARFSPSAGGGEVNFPIDNITSPPDLFANAESIVFWIKTPNVTNTAMYLTVYDQKLGAVREQFGKPYPVSGNFPKMTLVSAQTGKTTTHTLEWFLPIPGNFEGYVILPKSIFTQTIEGGDNNQFDSACFSELKLFFEANQPIAGQYFYIDDIGVTQNTQTYINGLINLIHPYGHSKHQDNTNMVVGNGMSKASDIGWKNIAAEIVTGYSQDGKAVKFTPTASGGEINFPIDTITSPPDLFANAESIVFWIKTPNATSTAMHITVYEQDGTNTEHFSYSYPSSSSIQTISTQKAVTQRQLGWYVPIPGNFEGYIAIPVSVFTQRIEGNGNSVFDTKNFSQIKIFFDAGQDIAGKDIYLDDIGITSNTQAYINSLVSPPSDNRLQQPGFGFYAVDVNVNGSVFQELLESDYCNTFIAGRSQHTMDPLIRTLRQVNNYGKTAWLGISESMYNFYGTYTVLDPNWQANLDYIMETIIDEGLYGCIRGIYFDEPFLARIDKTSFIQVTGYFRQTYTGKGVFACFSTAEILPSLWSPGYSIDLLDAQAGQYLTDAAYDYYEDARTNVAVFNQLTAAMKSRLGRSDVKIWYVPCTMSYRSATNETYSIAHLNDMYNRLKAESNPGGLMCYTYYTIPPEIEPMGNIGLDQLFADSNPNRWSTLEQRVQTIGKEILNGSLN